MRTWLAGVIAALMLFAFPVSGQKAGQTATQFYTEYRTAWEKAKTMDPLLPYMSKESRAQYEATPKAQRQPMFEMMKGFGALSNVKVVKETKTPTGFTLELTAVNSEKKPARGTAEIIVEDGAMKLKKESWNS
ncbi:MAG: hypothetical protein ABI900_02510 [Betaproteobacteria bacterium]